MDQKVSVHFGKDPEPWDTRKKKIVEEIVLNEVTWSEGERGRRGRLCLR